MKVEDQNVDDRCGIEKLFFFSFSTIDAESIIAVFLPNMSACDWISIRLSKQSHRHQKTRCWIYEFRFHREKIPTSNAKPMHSSSDKSTTRLSNRIERVIRHSSARSKPNKQIKCGGTHNSESCFSVRFVLCGPRSFLILKQCSVLLLVN